LASQILDHESRQALEAQLAKEESEMLRRNADSDRQRLEQEKQAKLAELEKAGVPERYRMDLVKKKVMHQPLHA